MKKLQLNDCPNCTTLKVKNTPVSMLCPVHAAAPELLEALRALAVADCNTYRVMQQRARAAIAKAEGVTS